MSVRPEDGAPEGRRLRIRGQVQGVGFRPFVWRLARDHGLTGEVLNDGAGVLVRAWGSPDAQEAFAAALKPEAPPLARIDSVEAAPERFATPPAAFEIAASAGGAADTRVTPDAATCSACLEEIAGSGRRRGYAFTNCTHCGPRYTILRGLPYDRAQTTMAPFEMCADCRAEYDDPADRRFHAQPIACPACGPRLWLEEGGAELPGDPIALAAARLQAGAILGIKGLGGYHLACDATDAEAVARLRARKGRPAKPFALMADLATIRRYTRVSSAEAARLADPAAPILLLEAAGAALPEAVAPGMAHLGFMLPATPLHHLLLAAAGRPLVMTSANRSGAPQVIADDAARAELAGIADGIVVHNRDIARRLDDGVERIGPAGPMVLRRGRGTVPGTLLLPEGLRAAPPLTAVGGHLKAAIAQAKSGQVLLSQHLGDLDGAEAWDEWQRAEADSRALFEIAPELWACDAHPGYRSTGFAEAAAGAAPLIRVQHHHAHLAGCLAENGWGAAEGPVVGVILDGLGWGADGTIWGGELLLGDYGQMARVGHLRPAPLPGGDAANREPWRNLLARLDVGGLGALAGDLLSEHPVETLRAAVAAQVNAPLSSSVGRLLDAAAALIGCAPPRLRYEGEAAMRLEALASRSTDPGAYRLDPGPEGLDPSAMFAALARDRAAGAPPADLARRVHRGLARAFAIPARRLVEAGQARAVALSGGCFQNAILTGDMVAALHDVRVLTHRTVPANDGGLALGQAAVAAAWATGR